MIPPVAEGGFSLRLAGILSLGLFAVSVMARAPDAWANRPNASRHAELIRIAVSEIQRISTVKAKKYKKVLDRLETVLVHYTAFARDMANDLLRAGHSGPLSHLSELQQIELMPLVEALQTYFPQEHPLLARLEERLPELQNLLSDELPIVRKRAQALVDLVTKGKQSIYSDETVSDYVSAFMNHNRDGLVGVTKRTAKIPAAPPQPHQE